MFDLLGTCQILKNQPYIPWRRFFLYPSFYEGFGLPVLEAMRAGTPVITSHCSALPEVAGTAAYTVDPSRISDVINGLELFWDNKKNAHRVRRAGSRTNY